MAPRVGAVALLAPAALVGVAMFLALAASGGCVKTGASLGQACLTNEDCFSGYCAQQLCVSAPPLLDAEARGDAPADSFVGSPPADAAGEASGDAPGDAPRANGDAVAADGPAADATSDTASDSRADVAADAGQDAPADVRLDVAEGG